MTKIVRESRLAKALGDLRLRQIAEALGDDLVTLDEFIELVGRNDDRVRHADVEAEELLTEVVARAWAYNA